MAELLESVQSNVLRASKEEALDFRTMQMDQCSMAGVAAALIAQVAISTLQLQYMPTIHWTIPALCTCSLILGLLSVYYSFQLHYSLANFTTAPHLRAAFARRPEGNEGGGEEQMEEGGSMLPSYRATFILWLPFSLLRLAIYFYLVAIVSYWGVAAEMDLQESRARSTIVSFLFLTPSSVFRADHEFLGLWIHLVGIFVDFISMVLGRGDWDNEQSVQQGSSSVLRADCGGVENIVSSRQTLVEICPGTHPQGPNSLSLLGEVFHSIGRVGEEC